MSGFNSNISQRFRGPLDNFGDIDEIYLPIVEEAMPDFYKSQSSGLRKYLVANVRLCVDELYFLSFLRDYVGSIKYPNKDEILEKIFFLENAVREFVFDEPSQRIKVGLEGTYRPCERPNVDVHAGVEPEFVKGSGIRKTRIIKRKGAGAMPYA